MTTALHWLLPPPPPIGAVTPLRPVSTGDGHDPRTLERWCREGGLIWVAGSVYLPRDVAGTPQARRAALELLTPRGATVAMATAVWCRGGPGLPPSQPTATDTGRARVELIVPAGCVPRSAAAGLRMRQCDVPGAQVERRGQLRLTSAPRTALDLARWGAGPDDDAALAWLWDHGVTPRMVAVATRDRRRTPGNRRVRAVVTAVRQGQRNPLSTIDVDAA